MDDFVFVELGKDQEHSTSTLLSIEKCVVVMHNNLTLSGPPIHLSLPFLPTGSLILDLKQAVKKR